MRFAVTRTSHYSSDDNPPCEGLEKEVRVIPRDDGSTFTHTVYLIEIADFNQLQSFLKTHGDCVIKEQGVSYVPEMELEIYDDYRE